MKIQDDLIVSLARKSKKRRLRDELVPKPGSKIPVGYGYNTRLSDFVQNHWDLERAATISPSLKRTLDRLAQGKNRVLTSEQKIPTPH